jgi:uncharacterized MAPEG superfamily protein
MTAYRMQNPVFVAYMIAASIMVLKVMGQGWMTVYRMMKTEMGLLNPEDLLPGPFNHNPDPRQLELNDYVERSRRTQRNDLENIPAFLAAGLLFVAVEPPAAITLLALFVIARLVHTIVYATGQRHEIRATPYTIGSFVVIFMAGYVLIAALLFK